MAFKRADRAESTAGKGQEGRLGRAAGHSRALGRFQPEDSPPRIRPGWHPGLPTLPAWALCTALSGLCGNVSAAEAPTVGTWFDGLGSPYGGCGVPQDLLETQDFVALNVYNTPGEYAKSPARPMQGADLASMGAFENGLNCGRWIRVTLGPVCSGTNDGAPGQPFCRGAGAQWVDDANSGGTLDMIVADSCGDGNAWCRDSRLHIDLSKASLARFSKDGTVLPNLEPAHWNNRALSWQYQPAPAYSGDVRIYFLKGAQKYWPAIMVTHLPNGIHAVEQSVGGVWKRADRYSDMGQGFILAPGEPFRIRLIDAADKPVMEGREYVFSAPAACGGATCDASATAAVYQAFPAGGAALRPRADHSLADGLSLHAIPGGLSLDFRAPWPGAWKVTALDARGRAAASAFFNAQGSPQGNTQGTQASRVELPGLGRGVYTLRFQSGTVRMAGKTFAIP